MVPAWCRTKKQFDVSTFYEGAEVSDGHFTTDTSALVPKSQNFLKGPKCPTDTSALVPKCLWSEVSVHPFQNFLCKMHGPPTLP